MIKFLEFMRVKIYQLSKCQISISSTDLLVQRAFKLKTMYKKKISKHLLVSTSRGHKQSILTSNPYQQ